MAGAPRHASTKARGSPTGARRGRAVSGDERRRRARIVTTSVVGRCCDMCARCDAGSEGGSERDACIIGCVMCEQRRKSWRFHLPAVQYLHACTGVRPFPDFSSRVVETLRCGPLIPTDARPRPASAGRPRRGTGRSGRPTRRAAAIRWASRTPQAWMLLASRSTKATWNLQPNSSVKA